jgi:hypothetical protein
MFIPTAEETVLVAQIFAEIELYCSKKPGSYKSRNRGFDSDSITSKQAVDIFAGARVVASVIQEILLIADPAQKGFLTRKDMGLAVRLLGWAQEGVAVDWSLVDRCVYTAHCPSS